MNEELYIYIDILDTRAFSVILNMIEEALKNESLPAVDREALTKIYGLRNLDEIWIACHTRIIEWHESKRKEIQDFLNIRQGHQ